MKKLLWIGLILALGVWLGTHVESDPGIVIIRVAGWRIDIPLWLGILLLIIFFMIWHYLIKCYDWLFHTNYFVGDSAQKRKKRRARRLTHKGFIELAEGDWQKAEKHFLQGAQHSEVPLLNYLSAAKAAQEQGEDKRRDKYLKLAHESTKDADIAIGLTQARLQYQQGQFEQSLATVKHLLSLAPHHPHILKLLKNIYLELKDWTQLLKLLPTLRKHKVINAKEELELEKKLFINLLSEQSRLNAPEDANKTQELWQKVPKRLQSDPQLVFPYASYLKENNRITEFDQLIRQSLKRKWSEALILLYGTAQFEDSQKAIEQAESWLRTHQESPNLLLTLGRLCVQSKLWGKAQRYLEASIKLSASPEAYRELGMLLEKVNQKDLSLEFFRKGLIASTPDEKLLLGQSDDPEADKT